MTEASKPWDDRLSELGWASWIIGLLGSASLTGLLAQLSNLPGRGGIEDFVSVFVAALAGLALTIGVVLSYVALAPGKLAGWPAVFVAGVCFVAGILVANLIGIGAVGTTAITTASSLISGAPAPLRLLLIPVVACVLTYGPIASLQAAVAGLLFGHWATLLAGEPAAT